MKIIFFGAPGSGKGTQAELIKKKYGIPHISTGNILRDAIKKKTEIGKIVKQDINNGNLVNDKIILNLIQNRIKKPDCFKGFILDGFPRTLIQAKEMEKKNIFINYIIEFNIEYKLIYERILGRRIHPGSGRIYHIKFNPPKIFDRDDITHEKLVIRKDDKKEIIQKRLLEYEEMKNTILEYYKNKLNKKNIKYYKIDASQKKNKIYKILKKILII